MTFFSGKSIFSRQNMPLDSYIVIDLTTATKKAQEDDDDDDDSANPIDSSVVFVKESSPNIRRAKFKSLERSKESPVVFVQVLTPTDKTSALSSSGNSEESSILSTDESSILSTEQFSNVHISNSCHEQVCPCPSRSLTKAPLQENTITNSNFLYIEESSRITDNTPGYQASPLRAGSASYEHGSSNPQRTNQKRPRSRSMIRTLARRPSRGLVVDDTREAMGDLPQFYKVADHRGMLQSRIGVSPNDCFTLDEFKAMWLRAETYFGETTEDIEEGSLVRAANKCVDREDSNGQLKAQYGRLLPDATDRLFRQILKLEKDDVFVDIGHGIGNTVLQAAYTVGCESRGIELVTDRNSIARQFQANIDGQLSILRKVGDIRSSRVGSVSMLRGRLEEYTHRDFLSKYKDSGTGSMKVFVNNFNRVFSERSSKANQRYSLDDFIAGLFALMKPGSVLVTLHPLILPLSFTCATRHLKQQKLQYNEDASFYEVQEIQLGKANECVSWSANGSNTRDIVVYRYTRLKQRSNNAVFICINPKCPNARNGTPIPATQEVDLGNSSDNVAEMRVVINHCDCKISGKTFRKRNHGAQ